MNIRSPAEKSAERWAVTHRPVMWAVHGARSPGARWQAEIRKSRPSVDFVTILRSRVLAELQATQAAPHA